LAVRQGLQCLFVGRRNHIGGNVIETVSDWYAELSDKSETNPKGPLKDELYVIRGGSFGNPVVHANVSVRSSCDTHGQANLVGFRIAYSSSSIE